MAHIDGRTETSHVFVDLAHIDRLFETSHAFLNLSFREIENRKGMAKRCPIGTLPRFLRHRIPIPQFSEPELYSTGQRTRNSKESHHHHGKTLAHMNPVVPPALESTLLGARCVKCIANVANVDPGIAHANFTLYLLPLLLDLSIRSLVALLCPDRPGLSRGYPLT